VAPKSIHVCSESVLMDSEPVENADIERHNAGSDWTTTACDTLRRHVARRKQIFIRLLTYCAKQNYLFFC